MIYVTKRTSGSNVCGKNPDKLECFECANTAASSKHCRNDTSELYSNWLEKKTEDGDINKTR